MADFENSCQGFTFSGFGNDFHLEWSEALLYDVEQMFTVEFKIDTVGYFAFLINQYLANSAYISMLLFYSSNSNNCTIKSNIQYTHDIVWVY